MILHFHRNFEHSFRDIMLAGAVLAVSATAFAAPEKPADVAPNRELSQQVPGPDPGALQSLRAQIEAMKLDYERRIEELEAQLKRLETQVIQMAPAPTPPPAQLAQAPGQAAQTVPGALNPAISVVGNFVGRADSEKIFNEDGDRIDNRMSLREVEIDMRVPVDPYADGVLIASLGAETPGRFSADVEEAYVTIKKLPFLAGSPLGLKLKAGRFRPAFGKSNILHTHDLPQSMRPLPIQEFLGEEGFVQNGLSGSFFIPTPWDEKSSLDATVEILNGGDIAVSPELRGRNSYLGHLRWFRTFREQHNLELGWSSYFHPSGNDIGAVNLHGVDFTYRWKPFRMGQWRSFLAGGEILFTGTRFPHSAQSAEEFRVRALDSEGSGRPKGLTLFGQWQFNRRTYAGLRWDRADKLVDSRLQRQSATPYLSYYFSEFLRFRLNYEHRWSDALAENRRNSVFLELNWVFGSHPPEPYWVNK